MHLSNKKRKLLSKKRRRKTMKTRTEFSAITAIDEPKKRGASKAIKTTNSGGRSEKLIE